MINRHLFVGFDEEAQAKRSFIFLVILVGFLLCCLVVTSFMAGYEWRNYLANEEKRAQELKPKRAQPATYAPFIGCDKPAVDEVSRICRARSRMTKVGQ